MLLREPGQVGGQLEFHTSKGQVGSRRTIYLEEVVQPSASSVTDAFECIARMACSDSWHSHLLGSRGEPDLWLKFGAQMIQSCGAMECSGWNACAGVIPG
jgi:hypothetical protein